LATYFSHIYLIIGIQGNAITEITQKNRKEYMTAKIPRYSTLISLVGRFLKATNAENNQNGIGITKNRNLFARKN
jgi:hypothetical protein